MRARGRRVAAHQHLERQGTFAQAQPAQQDGDPPAFPELFVQGPALELGELKTRHPHHPPALVEGGEAEGLAGTRACRHRPQVGTLQERTGLGGQAIPGFKAQPLGRFRQTDLERWRGAAEAVQDTGGRRSHGVPRRMGDGVQALSRGRKSRIRSRVSALTRATRFLPCFSVVMRLAMASSRR